MCGVIVVDAESFRSTNRGCDAYIMIIALDINMIISSSINFPTVICLPAVCYFPEKPLVKSTAPGSNFPTYCFPIYLFAAFAFRSIIPKTQKYLAALFICSFYFVFLRDLSLQSITT